MFSRITAGQGGLDPYSCAVSDIYHDLFNEGSFTGKGIIDLDAYLECLDGRFPQNTVLSMISCEGAYLRCGLIGDLEITDGCPSQVLSWFFKAAPVDKGRLANHSVAFWLCTRNRGKREKPGKPSFAFQDTGQSPPQPDSVFYTARALAPPLCPGKAPYAICGIFALPACGRACCFRICGCFGEAAFKKAPAFTLPSSAGRRCAGAPRRFSCVFLPYNAAISLSACVTALYRMLFTKTRMLELTTRRAVRCGSVAGLLRGISGKIIVHSPRRCLSAEGVFPSVFCFPVCGSPVPISPVYLSSPRKIADRITERDRVFLLREAALMWSFFDDFMNRENHYCRRQLQQQPSTVRRTAPLQPTSACAPVRVIGA
jgi:cyclic beta-1,2-glucan synthetase